MEKYFHKLTGKFLNFLVLSFNRKELAGQRQIAAKAYSASFVRVQVDYSALSLGRSEKAGKQLACKPDILRV